MKKVIYKYPLPRNSFMKVTLPKDCEILTIQEQRDELCLWALVDLKTEKVEFETKLFIIFATGERITLPPNESIRYISTFRPSPLIVLHIFELITGKETNPEEQPYITTKL